MERTYINEAQKAIGGTVKVQGFIENLRNSKYMAFIVLKDIGAFHIQESSFNVLCTVLLYAFQGINQEIS